MGQLQVLFHVPPEIEAKLASGEYRRVGGIIRNAADKQKIITHIKEAQGLEALTPASLPALLSGVGAVASVANLAVSVAGFALVLHKLGKMEKKLDALDAQMARLDEKLEEVTAITTAIEKLAWARLHGRLRAAMELATRASLVSPSLAGHHVGAALSKLDECQHEFSQLAGDDSFPPAVRASCAQWALLPGSASAALYAHVNEEAASLHVLGTLEPLASDSGFALLGGSSMLRSPGRRGRRYQIR